MLILKKIKKEYFLFVLIFVSVLAFGIVFFTARFQRVNKLKTQYVEISIDDDCSGIIKSVRPLIPRSYTSLVILSDNRFIMLPWAENWNLTPKHLIQFLEEGDSIYKPRMSDSLFIYRSERKYVFCLTHRMY